MAHPNENLVRRGFDAFSKGDVDTLRELFDQDAVWHTPVCTPSAGEREGRTLEDKSVPVNHVRNGKFVETWGQSEDQYAVDEFFS